MRAFRFIILFALVTFCLDADVLLAVCFDADSDCLLPTSEDFQGSNQIPKIEYDAGGKPTVLGWTTLPAGVFSGIEMVGRYKGQAIWRVIYRKRDAVNPATQSFVAACFGYEHATPNGPRIQLFFVASSCGENIRAIDSSFTTSDMRPFGLTIQKSIRGNGVYWEDYTFVFTPDTARIVERSEGGRKMDMKVFRYNKVGKIISTEASSGN